MKYNFFFFFGNFLEKVQRLKEAKEEADREIAEFRAKKEEEFQQYSQQVFSFFFTSQQVIGDKGNKRNKGKKEKRKK